MSTNYYLVQPNEDFDPDFNLHIGKASGGTYSFQGHLGKFDAPLTSWAQWKNLILQVGSVWSEYGEQVPAGEFIRRVETVKRSLRGEQYDWLTQRKDDPLVASHLKNSWVDPDGWSFTSVEFF